jgi:hypothetical protein
VRPEGVRPLQETTALGKTLELFWSRINSSQGTTNMDFELNRKFCDPTNCAGNGITPLRTTNDKLISYDLSQGGTVPTISIRTWDGSVWGPADVISGGSNPDAVGSVNTTTIPENQAGGAQPAGIGEQDPFTFGERPNNVEVRRQKDATPAPGRGSTAPRSRGPS